MSLIYYLKRIVTGRRDDLAEQILQELKDECPKRSGKTAEKGFYISRGGHGTGTSVSLGGSVGKGGIGSVFVGSDKLTAYWADQGNGGENKIIMAKHKRKSGAMGALGEYPDGIPGIGWKQYVHGYEGRHFVKKVADRHR